MNARITAVRALPEMPMALRGGWRVANHSHMLRSHSVDFEGAKRNLVAWALAQSLDAVGVGSPWEPVSAQSYKRHETVDRDRYFAGLVPPESVMDRAPIANLLRDLNAAAGGRVCFHLDNETPKNRHGHLWYVGFDYQVPAWHDYSQDRPVQFTDRDPPLDMNQLTGAPHRRRTYMEVVARQRQAGALAIWAHPTSWWRQAGAFVTNIAAELVTHLHADGFLDGVVVQGYDAWHRSYQALWFALLDRGAHVPGFAELDACFDQQPIAPKGCFVNWLPGTDGQADVERLKPLLRQARHTVTSGPRLRLIVDGHTSGAAVPSGATTRHAVRIEAWPAPGEATLGRIQLLGTGGRVLAEARDFRGGEIDLTVDGDDAGGWLLARVCGANDDPSAARQQSIRHCALTNPVYLEAPQSHRFTAVSTEMRLSVSAGSPWRGAELFVRSAVGEEIERGHLREPVVICRVPASAEIVVRQGSAERRTPLVLAAEPSRAHIDYLAHGQFLRDWPDAAPGEVPVEAFRIDAVRDACAHIALTLDALR
jgi:hypothetical protein